MILKFLLLRIYTVLNTPLKVVIVFATIGINSYCLAQSQSSMGSDNFPINDNGYGSVPSAVNTGWQINGFGKVNRVIRSSSALYALTASGGIYKSNNNGQYWYSLSGSFLPGVQMNALSIDPIDTNILYAGTGEVSYAANYGWGGYGVFKSTDGGNTWNVSNTGMGNIIVSDILVDKNNRAHVVASGSTGLFLSVDSGLNWVRKISSGTWMEQIVQRGNSDSLFAISGDSLFTSVDFGNNWTVRNLDPSSSMNYLKGRITIAPSDNRVIYATWLYTISGNYMQSEIFQSTDGGTTFTKKYSSSSLPALCSYDATLTGSGYGWANYCIAVDPLNSDVVYTGAHLIFRSTDGAASFINTISGWWCCIHTDIHDINFSPSNSDSLFASTDGGVFVSPNQGLNWSPLSSGMSCTQYFTFGQSHVDSNYVVGGTQDNGIMFLKNDNNVHTYAGGDYYYFTQCDYFNPHNTYTNDIVASGLVFDPYYRANSAPLNLPSDLSSVTFSSCLEFSQLNPGRAFGFNTDVWITNNLDNYVMSSSGGTSSITWSNLTNLSGANITSLAIAPDNDNRIYFITNLAEFYTCNISGGVLQSIQSISIPASTNVSSSIAVSTLNPDVIFVMADNTILHSSDGGKHFEDISGNLPNINFQAIYIDPYSTVEGVYLVSDMGVYYHDWTLNNWNWLNPDFQTNLQNPSATFFQIIAGSGIFKGSSSASSHISMGTWGAGFQKANFYVQKCDPLPPFYVLNSFGNTFGTNTACYDNTNGGAAGSNAITVTTNGAGIGGTDDQFSMVAGNLVNDGSLTCRLYSIQKGDSTSPGETGLMFRTSSSLSNSPFIMAGLNANGKAFIRYRLTSGATAIDSIVSTPLIPYPIDLKLIRTGNSYAAIIGGVSVGSFNVVLGDTILGGIAASSGNSSLVNQTAFGDIIDSGFTMLSVGIKNQTSPVNALLFPDPAHNNITIKLNIAGEYSYRIFDVLGVNVLDGMIPLNSFTHSMDVSKLKSGNYFIELVGRNGINKGRYRFVKN